ncbi:MAG: NADH-quinone oxidoreductase subunit NuoF [Oligoflexales bacterium]|nr:NADH-quinone oxidoreductase subunit NuoF [Oligoflexales bacterium]
MEQHTQILTHWKHIPNSRALSTYIEHRGYEALKTSLATLKPEQVIQLVKDSGLRGRGGAGFPTGMKWGFVPKAAPEKYLLCNNDEGEPGTFKDRYLIELSPHSLVEGMILSAYAIGAKKGYIYTRCEFYEEIEWIEKAIEEAYKAGFLGDNILGSGFSFHLDHYRGAGAYICGEETGLISSLEGKKGQPKLKPPFPAISGYLGKPTVVNNTETLAVVPWLILNGPQAYKKIGTEKSAGTKLFCISGPVVRPGVYELPLGYSLKKFIYEDAGGLLPGKALKGVIPGGASAPILVPEEVEKVTLDYESMAQAGTMLGSGAVMIVPEDHSILELLKVTVDFFHHESCGQCTPCREGTGWIANILMQMTRGQGSEADLDRVFSIADHMMGRTICALSDAAAMPTKAILKKFRAEIISQMKVSRQTNRTVPQR